MPASSTGPWKIGHVEDHSLTARGLRDLLAPEPDLEWVGSADTVEEFIAHHPDVDVVVLDLRLPDGSEPQDNVERLNELGIRCLVYTSGEHSDLLRSAARAGVLGTVMKRAKDATVVAAIRSVAQGQPVLSTEWAAAIDSDLDYLARVDLSPRLQQVLSLTAMGKTADSVGRELNIKPGTVYDYLERIKVKYAAAGRPVDNRATLIVRAVEDGYIQTGHNRRRRG